MSKIHYLVKNPFLKVFLRCIDFFGYRYFKKIKSDPHKTFQKILICNIAHLGDAVIFSSLIPLIHSSDQKIKIGVLVGSSSKSIFLDRSDVEWLHLLDHWKLNRSSIHKLRKIIRYFFQKRQAISDIRKMGYDLAIDFYPFFPNTNYVLWKSKVPIRIGYNSGGFGFFLTKALPWESSTEFILDRHTTLLKSIFPNCSNSKIKPSLLTKSHDLLKWKGCVIFHVGTGNPIKEWSEKNWKTLIKNLKYDVPFVFTGKGEREKKLVSSIISRKTNCNDLVDQLSLNNLIEIIANAKLVICCDSLPVHLAWAFEKPAIVLQIGTQDPDLWTPPNPRASYLRSTSSEGEISVGTVLSEIHKKMN